MEFEDGNQLKAQNGLQRVFTISGVQPEAVYTPRFLHDEADCDVPLVYCYDGSHYEGLIPETIEDEQKCSRLVELWEREEYMTHVQDIPVLWNQLSEDVSRMFKKHLTDKTR